LAACLPAFLLHRSPPHPAHPHRSAPYPAPCSAAGGMRGGGGAAGTHDQRQVVRAGAHEVGVGFNIGWSALVPSPQSGHGCTPTAVPLHRNQSQTLYQSVRGLCPFLAADQERAPGCGGQDGVKANQPGGSQHANCTACNATPQHANCTACGHLCGAATALAASTSPHALTACRHDAIGSSSGSSAPPNGALKQTHCGGCGGGGRVHWDVQPPAPNLPCNAQHYNQHTLKCISPRSLLCHVVTPFSVFPRCPCTPLAHLFWTNGFAPPLPASAGPCCFGSSRACPRVLITPQMTCNVRCPSGSSRACPRVLITPQMTCNVRCPSRKGTRMGSARGRRHSSGDAL